MNYKKLKDCWVGLERYNLNGKTKYLDKLDMSNIEYYSGPVTLSYPEWVNYISSGNNVLLGSGGVIPGCTQQTGFGLNSAVYKGHVRKGYKWYG